MVISVSFMTGLDFSITALEINNPSSKDDVPLPPTVKGSWIKSFFKYSRLSPGWRQWEKCVRLDFGQEIAQPFRCLDLCGAFQVYDLMIRLMGVVGSESFSSCLSCKNICIAKKKKDPAHSHSTAHHLLTTHIWLLFALILLWQRHTIRSNKTNANC